MAQILEHRLPRDCARTGDIADIASSKVRDSACVALYSRRARDHQSRADLIVGAPQKMSPRDVKNIIEGVTKSIKADVSSPPPPPGSCSSPRGRHW